MEYQKNWTRPAPAKRIEDPNCISNYYEILTRYPEELRCNTFNVTLINAYVHYREMNTKKGDQQIVELLHLVMQIDNTSNYVEFDIWGRRKTFYEGAWGQFGNNPAPLQDFLYLVGIQKKGVKDLMDHYDITVGREDREVYPHLCGSKFKLLATKYGERFYNGKTYDNEKFAVFSTEGLSALEIQQKITVEKSNDFRLTLNGFKESYRNWAGVDPEEVNTEEVEVEAEQNVLAEAYDSYKKDNAFVDQSPADDLPF